MESIISLLIIILGIYIFIRLLPFMLAIIATLVLIGFVVAVYYKIKYPTTNNENQTSSNTSQIEPDVIDVEYTEEDIEE